MIINHIIDFDNDDFEQTEWNIDKKKKKDLINYMMMMSG